MTQLESLFDLQKPSTVINCIGATRANTTDPEKLIEIYAVFPKNLQRICERRGIRLIHISTDGVFSGAQGNYSELDTPDATDPYGTAKILGEITVSGAITLRTSVIGRQLAGDQD